MLCRMAWRNLWRQPRRTWLTTGAMVFSNALLVFMISFQFGMYRLMIDNSLQAFTGHMQVQAPGYKDDQKMRQTVPDVQRLAALLRDELGSDTIAARATTFVLASSEERTYGIAVFGVEPDHEPAISSIPGLVSSGRFLNDVFPHPDDMNVGASRPHFPHICEPDPRPGTIDAVLVVPFDLLLEPGQLTMSNSEGTVVFVVSND